ncbi:MAG: hypothetical protein Q9225_001016 [Loekoesia sp. 1 TL-2023]
MPRTIFPPTPAPSMDIVGKDGGPQLPLKDKASFALPPPAIAPAPCRNVQTTEEERLQAQAGSEYSLPPPPTRSRKIIQVTPKIDSKGDPMGPNTKIAPAKTRHAVARASLATHKATDKKQPSSTSQAGKRIARKTAHSVIERRRRSKMNEEFGVLKDMIPACRNQEMHKLAILQASRKSSAANGAKSSANNQRSPQALQQSTPPEYHPHAEDDDDDDDEGDEDEDSDVDMTGHPEIPSMQTTYQEQTPGYNSPQSATTSPALDALQCQKATSYTSCLSGLPSPAIGPQSSIRRQNPQQIVYSASTSPNLVPTLSKEADEEATAALLMLNRDRRNTNTSSNSSNGRGMSVKDLLSS